MARKISRRNFLKGTGKVTATLATIWAIGGSFELPEVEAAVEETEPDKPDIWNHECHPYFCSGGVTLCAKWEEDVW